MCIFLGTLIQLGIQRKLKSLFKLLDTRPWQWRQRVPKCDRVPAGNLVLNRYTSDGKIRGKTFRRFLVFRVDRFAGRFIWVDRNTRRHQNLVAISVISLPMQIDLVGRRTRNINDHRDRIALSNVPGCG